MTAVLIIGIVLAGVGWLLQLAVSFSLKDEERAVAAITVLLFTAAIVAMSLALGLGV